MFSFHFHLVLSTCFTVPEILFEKTKLSFCISQRVWLSWYMTSLIVKMYFQNKLGVLTKINPELSLSLRHRGCSAAILHLPQFNWFSCWLHCTDHWILETWGFNINHSRMFRFKLWNSDGWATQESVCEQELQRLAVSPQKSCLEPHPEGKSREHTKFLHPDTQ